MSKLIAAAAVVFADHPDAKAVYVCEDGNVFLEERKNLAESHCMTSRLRKPDLVKREDVDARLEYERREAEEAEVARLNEAEEAEAARLNEAEKAAAAQEADEVAHAAADEAVAAQDAEEATIAEQKGSGKGKKGGK